MGRRGRRIVCIEDILPVQATCGDCLVGNRGDVTLGWELTLPPVHSMDAEGYDALLSSMKSAALQMDPWTVIHRQDLYTYREYAPEEADGWLGGCYETHFAGRRYLRHTARVFVTMSARGTAMGSEMGKMVFYSRRPDPRYPSLKELEEFRSKAERFISTLTSGGRIRRRLLTEEDYRGTEYSPGLIQRNFFLDSDSLGMGEIGVTDSTLRIAGHEVVSFSVPSTRFLPNAIDSVVREEAVSTSSSTLWTSLGSRLGMQLPCDHMVNQYIVMAPQRELLSSLEETRRHMEGGINAAENRVSAEELSTYIDLCLTDSLTTVYSHVNVIAWDAEGRTESLLSRLATAFASAGISYCWNRIDTMNLLQAACPGGETELGAENYMLCELGQALSFAAYETVGSGIPGGLLKLCDRTTGVPVRLDVQRAAKAYLNILNYNIFLLGPSGSGKSFLTNLFLRGCWEAGEHVFVIDVGDSYEGLCGIIRELSGGEDGVYHTWDSSHPFSFNPFSGCRDWEDEDSNGRSFMLTLLRTLWSPEGGWTGSTAAILESFLDEFLIGLPASGRDPLFTDFVDWLGTVAMPQVLAGTWQCGYAPIGPGRLDIADLMASLHPYSASGRYGFLLNNPEPPDLFASRFVVFEVDALAQKGRELLYSVCMLCIMNSFDDKIRRSQGFKVMCIEEAWQAISKDFMADYLRGLWKTARKYQTSAMVVSQEITDITASETIKDTILTNSSIRMILTQEGSRRSVDILRETMGYGEREADMIMSVGRDLDPSEPRKEVFVSWDSKMCGVYVVEASREEALAYESDKVRKRPLLDRAKELGSIRCAIEERVASERENKVKR